MTDCNDCNCTATALQTQDCNALHPIGVVQLHAVQSGVQHLWRPPHTRGLGCFPPRRNERQGRSAERPRGALQLSSGERQRIRNPTVSVEPQRSFGGVAQGLRK